MIIPSIDIQDGQAVQLLNGKHLILNAGDPIDIARYFSIAGEIAVIDLDAAMGKGSNRGLISKIVREYPCRVGGGIRDYETAKYWLNSGAQKIIIGSAAKDSDFINQLQPFRDRVIIALDSLNERVMINGWTEYEQNSVFSRIEELKDKAGGFLFTFIEGEGEQCGVNLARAEKIHQSIEDIPITIAGGVKGPSDIKALDELEMDAQVGMSLYSGNMSLAEGILAPLQDQELIPTVVTDEWDKVLGFVYSNYESVTRSVESGTATYYSRKRGIWKKGKTSGNTQSAISIIPDCDRDCLKIQVKQLGKGCFCHRGTRNCWGNDQGLSKLERILNKPLGENSYTQGLLGDPVLLKSKILEESLEVIEAKTENEITHEAADLLYFLLVLLKSKGISLTKVEHKLTLRSLKVK